MQAEEEEDEGGDSQERATQPTVDPPQKTVGAALPMRFPPVWTESRLTMVGSRKACRTSKLFLSSSHYLTYVAHSMLTTSPSFCLSFEI